MGRLGGVIEALGVLAGFAAEEKEVELVAVGVLAMRADGFEVRIADHAAKGRRRVGRWGVC